MSEELKEALDAFGNMIHSQKWAPEWHKRFAIIEEAARRARLSAERGEDTVRLDKLIDLCSRPTKETTALIQRLAVGLGRKSIDSLFEPLPEILIDDAAAPEPKLEYECVHHPEHRNCGKKNCAGFKPDAPAPSPVSEAITAFERINNMLIRGSKDEVEVAREIALAALSRLRGESAEEKK